MHQLGLVLLSLLSALEFGQPLPCKVTRYVSPINGTNDSSCLNSTNPVEHPCKNLSFAHLGTVFPEPNFDNYSTAPDNLCVYLHDGIHYLSGKTQLWNTTNMLLKGLNPGSATVRCRSFPNTIPELWDDVSFFHSSNITVMNVIFEHCGPYGSGFFAFGVKGLHIQNCTFRYAYLQVKNVIIL